MVADGETVKPDPDPTIFTTKQLLREIDLLEKRLETQITGLVAVREEEFRTVDLQFKLIERQRQEQKIDDTAARLEQKSDTQKAVDAAFSAAKDAVREQTSAFGEATDKSERAMAKQVEQLSTLFDTSIRAITDTLAELKDRLGKIEFAKVGGQQAYAGIYAFAAFISVVVVVVATVIAISGR